jgi:hypothetical protein
MHTDSYIPSGRLTLEHFFFIINKKKERKERTLTLFANSSYGNNNAYSKFGYKMKDLILSKGIILI